MTKREAQAVKKTIAVLTRDKPQGQWRDEIIEYLEELVSDFEAEAINKVKDPHETRTRTAP